MSREIGLFVQFSARPTFLDDAEIVGVEPTKNHLLVHSIIFRRTGIGPAEVGYPWHYIAIPRTNLPIEFAKTLVTDDTLRPASLASPTPRPTATP
jgi:hypothetical protein